MPILNYPLPEDTLQGRPGMATDDGGYIFGDTTLVNNNPRTAQVATITYTGFTGTKSILLDNVLIEASGGSIDLLCTAMTLAINSEPLVSGLVSAVADLGANTVTITARNAGVGFTISEVADTGAEQAIAATTADDDADPVPFGRGLIRDSTSDTRARLAATGGLSAKVYDVTPTNVNAVTYGVTVHLQDGSGQSYGFEYLSDGSATVQEIVEALVAGLNGQLPANTVIATEDNTKVTLTAEIAGLDFTVETTVDLTAVWTEAGVTVGNATDINKMFCGVAMEDLTQRGNDDGTNEYGPNQPMRVRRSRPLYVVCEDGQPNPTDPVYIGVGSTHEGKWRKSASGANYLRLDSRLASWKRSGGTFGTQTLGVLSLNLPS